MIRNALALLKVQGREEEAVKLLQEVQRQDPSLPHTWFNLGIYYKHQGDTQQAIAQFEGLLARTPDEAIAHYQLGTLYNQVNRRRDAQAQFERAAELDPLLAAARFQLYNLDRVDGNAAAAGRYLADFERIKNLQKSWVIPENAEWCDYAEIYDPPAARAQTAAAPEPKFTETKLEGTVDPATAGLTLIDSKGIGQTDLLVWSSRGILLFLKGQQPAVETGLEGLTGVIDVAPGDFNDDGLMDLCVLTQTGPALYRNTGGKFVRAPAALPARRFDRAVWMDYDHDYDLDLFLLGPEPALMRNQGVAGWADRTGDFPFIHLTSNQGTVTSAQKLRVNPDSKAFDLAVFYRDHAPVLYRDQLGGRYTVEAFHGQPAASTKQVDADFSATGRMDRARIDPDGSIHLLRSQNAQTHWIRVQLKGVRSLKLAQDALVEMKAGTLYRSQFYAGVPVEFDAGEHPSVDVIRITWPNGLIQNEVRQAADQTHVYQEEQRLSGSCPMIWTWNGREFQFITDVLGVAPLGARDGEGGYFPVDHQEYVQIPGAALHAVNNHYEVRVTEELSEVSYLDQIQLYAVDHPASTQIFTNEKFKSPPYPEFRLFSVEHRIYPTTARDNRGEDVLLQVMAQDGRYPDHFRRSETGVAELHTLDLDFGSAAPSGKAILVLNGWVDWPDGSTFLRASQESAAGLVMPYLQVQGSRGAWKTVNPDMGMPAGKPKTIVVPVEFLSASRKIRIVTNLCVYWDEIFLSEGASDARLKPVAIPFDSADLHFRGFSETRIDPQRKQPDTFFYGRVSPVSFWNPTPGLYTRYGRVDNLLRNVDDRLAIMGSGDEVTLQFPASDLPAIPKGMTRDFLLKVDGWAKDRDPNTAFSSTVQPLPFHAMSRYPYPVSEHYPRDAAHDAYQRSYNTRSARVLLGSLESK